MDAVRDFLQSYGVWTIFLLWVAKYATGLLVALKTGEFKAFYMDENLRSDAIKIFVYAILTGLAGVPDLLPLFATEETRLALGALLSASLAAGAIKNLVHIFPEMGEYVPKMLREPARLRLGNPKNAE